jgi:hypothetical protein
MEKNFCKTWYKYLCVDLIVLIVVLGTVGCSQLSEKQGITKDSTDQLVTELDKTYKDTTTTELTSFTEDFYVVDTSICYYNSAFITIWKSADKSKGLIIRDEPLYWQMVDADKTKAYSLEVQVGKEVNVIVKNSDIVQNRVIVTIGDNTYTECKLYELEEE